MLESREIKRLARRYSFYAEAALHSLSMVSKHARKALDERDQWIVNAHDRGVGYTIIARVSGLHRNQVVRIVKRNYRPVL